MSIGKAALPVQFQGGVDTRTDAKQVAATQLLDLQNCVFTKQTTLSKRNGYEALGTNIQSTGIPVTGAKGLAERDGEVILFTDQRAYSHRPSSDEWADTGEIAATTLTTRPICRTGTFQTQGDIATRNGVSVCAWEDSRGGVWCSILETETGRVLRDQLQLDSASLARNPRCVAVGEVIHVIWTREDLGQLSIVVVNPSSPLSTLTPSALTGDLDPTKPFFDAEIAPNGPASVFNIRPAVIAWAQVGGGYRVGYLSPSGVLGSPATGLPSVATYTDVLNGPLAVAYDGSGHSIAVAWAFNSSGMLNNVAVRFVDTVTLTIVQRQVLTLGGTFFTYSRVAIAFGANGSDQVPMLSWAAEVAAIRSDLSAVHYGTILQSTSTNDGVVSRLRGHGLVSRAWHDGPTLTPSITQDGDAYVLVAHTARFFPYVAALRISSDNVPAQGCIVSRILPGTCAGSIMRPTGAGTRAWTQHLPSVIPVDIADGDLWSRQHAVIVPYRLQLSSQNGDQFSEQGFKLAVINFDAPYRAVQFGRGLYLASSSPQHYDGSAWHEADFHTAPDLGFDMAGAPVLISTTAASGGGGAVPNGTYAYKYWYEAVDAQGELHRGPTSVTVLFTVSGGPLQVQLTIPTCRLTRFGAARIAVARTAQGATGTDTQLPFFRVTSNDPTVSTGANRYIANDPTTDTVVFLDNLTDAQLTTREPLYTNGGPLSNAPSSWAGGVIAVGKGRLFWTDSSDPLIVNFSKQRAEDTGLEAPIDLAISVDPLGGPVTALAALDEAILAFKATSIYGFAGPGPLDDPNAAPEANAFSLPELITSDVGCDSEASICATPVGIAFKSRKGIMMMTRDRQIADIGNPVEAYNEQSVTRTTLLSTAQRILFLTDAGRSLLWDYNRGQWSTYTNHTGLDAIVVDNLYYYLRTDSRVFRETPGLYRDDNSRIPMLIDTAWFHFAPYLQGWQRILYAYFLGAWKSPHSFSLRYRIDYNDAWSHALIANVNANHAPDDFGTGAYGTGAFGGAFGGATRYQRRFHLNKRCQSVSFRIEDIEATGDAGASFELSELLLIGGGIGADFKVGAARSG